jgi:hypothetical protein
MGSYVPGAPCIKGAACQALDTLSADRAGLVRLKDALQGIQNADYAGLEIVLGRHLLPAIYNASAIEKIVAHLRARWFDPGSPDCFFPGEKVACIYGQGLNMTLSLALGSTPHLPIDAWWALHHRQVEMLNFKSPLQVTLVIATPPPPRTVERLSAATPATVGYSTGLQDGAVGDYRLPIPKQ